MELYGRDPKWTVEGLLEAAVTRELLPVEWLQEQHETRMFLNRAEPKHATLESSVARAYKSKKVKPTELTINVTMRGPDMTLLTNVVSYLLKRFDSPMYATPLEAVGARVFDPEEARLVFTLKLPIERGREWKNLGAILRGGVVLDEGQLRYPKGSEMQPMVRDPLNLLPFMADHANLVTVERLVGEIQAEYGTRHPIHYEVLPKLAAGARFMPAPNGMIALPPVVSPEQNRFNLWINRENGAALIDTLAFTAVATPPETRARDASAEIRALGYFFAGLGYQKVGLFVPPVPLPGSWLEQAEAARRRALDAEKVSAPSIVC